MSSAAPGWYADPGDARQYRYWNGWAWTAGVSRDGVVREQAITAQSVAQVLAGREDHRAEWPARSVFIGVGGALGAIALAVGVSVAVDAVLDDQFLVTFVAAQLALWAGLLLTCVFVSRRYASSRLLQDYALSFRAIDLARGAVLSIIARVVAIPLIVPLVILLDLDSRESLNDLEDVARGPVGTTITVIFSDHRGSARRRAVLPRLAPAFPRVPVRPAGRHRHPSRVVRYGPPDPAVGCGQRRGLRRDRGCGRGVGYLSLALPPTGAGNRRPQPLQPRPRCPDCPQLMRTGGERHR